MILRGAAALFDASANVTREDWQRYTEKLQASQLIAGIQGIGFSKLIQPDELQAHTAEIREQGFPDYRVTPELEREIYTSIVYLEPFNERNQRAFGFDMYSEPVRRAAMDQAQDTGNAALSGKVMLVQETDEDIQSGALMYVPVYQQGSALSTINDRRNALIGWSYSPYRMRDLMQGILGDWENIDGKAVGIAIYDGLSNASEQLLYSNHILDAAPISQIITKTLTFNGHHWTLVFQHLGPYPNVNYNVACSTLISGILFSLMMLLLFKSLTKTRLRAEKIAARLTEEVRNREAALIESEFRWRFAIEGFGDGLWDWNVANKTLFYSPHWENTNRLDRELLHILYAGVEHAAWVELLEAALRNPDLPLPEINPTLCNFGRWLHNFSKSHNIKLNKLRKIHSTLHNLASQLSAQRNKPEFVMDPAIHQIFLLRDDLLRELDHLIETTSEKSNSST